LAFTATFHWAAVGIVHEAQPIFSFKFKGRRQVKRSKALPILVAAKQEPARTL
jgi:hypothetical protein